MKNKYDKVVKLIIKLDSNDNVQLKSDDIEVSEINNYIVIKFYANEKYAEIDIDKECPQYSTVSVSPGKAINKDDCLLFAEIIDNAETIIDMAA